MVYSYDIFDTILYRCVPRSIDIFKIMENDPVVNIIWTNHKPFAECRRKAEFWLRRKSVGEINIEKIYEAIKKQYDLVNNDERKLLELELKIEQEQSFLNSLIVEDIKAHIENGDTVILISDMYWHEKQLREWLCKKNSLFCNIKIFVSCDCGCTKSSGKLYSYVQHKLKINEKWIHTGDNKHSDGNVPRKLGIDANVVAGPIKYDFEKKLGSDDINLLSTYGSISKSRNCSNNSAFDLGASIVGPMVYQYVDWVLTEAQFKGVEKLFFVLRDGYVLKFVADKIIQSRGLSISTDFLFGSRVAWRLPEITIEKLQNLSVWDKSNWIFRDPCMAYVAFERLGFRAEELSIYFGSEFGKRVLKTFSDFKTVLDFALNNTHFRNQLANNIVEAGDNLELYLKQTINFTERFALVDTNSTGKTQSDLDSFLKKRKLSNEEKTLRFFYHTFLSDKEPDAYTQYVFIKADEADKRLPEAFFRAPYNPCLGYKHTPHGIEPKFHEGDYCAWTFSFDYDSYLRGILSFTKTIMKHPVDIGSYVDILFKVVNFNIVSHDEIKQVSKLPFNPNINGDEIIDFYPEIKPSALFHPFSELIYYPKGSYYYAGGLWILLYKLLYGMVKMRRKIKTK